MKTRNLESAIMAFRHVMNSALIKEAKQRGYSLSHFEVMKYIVERGNPTMKEVARQLDITPPSASSLVDVLVSRKLVNRNQRVGDRRTIHLTLTPKAQALLVSIHKKKNSVFNKMLANLSSDDKNKFAELLTKCISHK